MELIDVLYDKKAKLKDVIELFVNDEITYTQFKFVVQTLFTEPYQIVINNLFWKYAIIRDRVDPNDLAYFLACDRTLNYRHTYRELSDMIANSPSDSEEIYFRQMKHLDKFYIIDLLDQCIEKGVSVNISTLSDFDTFFRKKIPLNYCSDLHKLTDAYLVNQDTLFINQYGELVVENSCSELEKAFRDYGEELLSVLMTTKHSFEENLLNLFYGNVEHYGYLYSQNPKINTYNSGILDLVYFDKFWEYDDYLKTVVGVFAWFNYIVKHYVLKQDLETQQKIVTFFTTGILEDDYSLNHYTHTKLEFQLNRAFKENNLI